MMIKKDDNFRVKQHTVQLEAGSIPHPIINSMIGNNVKYNDNIMEIKDGVSVSNGEYTLMQDGNRFRRFTRFPFININNVNFKNYNGYIPLSLIDVIKAQANIYDKEYKYTIDLGIEIEDKTLKNIQDLKNNMKMSKITHNSNYDFTEWQYKIPVYTRKSGKSEFSGVDYLKDAKYLKLSQIDLEFDTVVPENSFTDNSYEDAYIKTPPLLYLYNNRYSENYKVSLYSSRYDYTMSEIPYNKGITRDYVDKSSHEYMLNNSLSGRHCKYQMTALKSPKRKKTLIHNDMIYDTLTHSNFSENKVLTHSELIRFYCGGFISNSRFSAIKTAYSMQDKVSQSLEGRRDSDGVTYNSTYPLPLNVTFEFDVKENVFTNNDIFDGENYVQVGYIVVRTYKGIRYFMPPNMQNLIKENMTEAKIREFYNSDMWIDYLRAFTMKITIPNIPVLEFGDNNSTYAVEVFCIPTITQLSGSDIKFTNGNAHDNEHIKDSIKPNNFIEARYISHFNTVDGKSNGDSAPFLEFAFMRHIRELGGFNGFLLPPERRCIDWSSKWYGNTSLYNNYESNELS